MHITILNLMLSGLLSVGASAATLGHSVSHGAGQLAQPQAAAAPAKPAPKTPAKPIPKTNGKPAPKTPAKPAPKTPAKPAPKTPAKPPAHK